MRFIIAPEFYEQMREQEYHLPDCYVRPGEYLHHMYIDGVKYVVVPALEECLKQAEERNDAGRDPAPPAAQGALRQAVRGGPRRPATWTESRCSATRRRTSRKQSRRSPTRTSPGRRSKWEDLGLPLPFLFDLILRTIYNRGQLTGGELAHGPPRPVQRPSHSVLQLMRKQSADRHRRPEGVERRRVVRVRDQAAQGHVRASRTPWPRPATSAPRRSRSTTTSSPSSAQSIKKLVVTRLSIQRAFEDLIITRERVQRDRPGDQLGRVDLLLRLPRQRQDQHRRAHHAAHGRRHLHPLRRRGQRADHQGVRPDPAHRGRRTSSRRWSASRPVPEAGPRTTTGSSASSGRPSSSAAS